MARWHKKVDANQKRVFAALRARRVLVFDTHEVGEGFPDGIALFPGRTVIELPGNRLRIFDGALVMVEVKDAGGRLNGREQEFLAGLGPHPPYLIMRTGEEEL
jgi:hypothetical protein